MISDKETNTIYFSELIKTDSRFIETSNKIFSKLDNFGVKYKFLPKTKDIWARDYMPIQISDSKFIEYRYDPDYLQGHLKDYRNLKTYPDIVCDSINLKTEKVDLIMDGGNMVKSSNCIILTEKIVKENKYIYSKNDLIKKLHKTFEVDKVVLIPTDKIDIYGHSDGMIRFIDNDNVLINHFYENDSILKYRLKQAGLNPVFLQFKRQTDKNKNWAYINFLQTKDLILLPKFDIEEDNAALEQIEKYYPNYKNKIAQINMTDFVKLGGALNCITWTIKS